MQLTLKDQSGGSAESTIDIADVIAGAEFNEALVHQVVTAYMAGARSGTKAQKTRAQVRGGGAKPWKQKGLGRARAGSIRSPIWRGGGVTFAATPRNYAQKVNKKMYRSAMRSILSELIRQDRLMVLEDLSISAPKTKELVSRLEALGTNDVLIVTAEVDETLELAARNLYWAAVVSSSELNPVSLLAFQKVAMTAPAMKMLEERLS